MSLRLRFIIDTNILIPLQDPHISLKDSLKNFIRLAGIGGHQLLYHPASIADILRDPKADRRDRMLARLDQYQKLEDPPKCTWSSGEESPNDACDNEILFSLECEAVHALITEDKGIHKKAKKRGLGARVYSIQTAEDWLRRLHEPAKVQLPNVEDVPIYTLVPGLGAEFFNSLREDYSVPPFDTWFRKKAQEGRRGWVVRGDDGSLGALCIYAIQEDERINEGGDVLLGKSLKLCTFKVGDLVRGRKIGELFLKASFQFATESGCSNIFIHGNSDKQPYLANLLDDFGFLPRGSYGGDVVWVKEHPALPPDIAIAPKEYVRLFFPHFRKDGEVAKYIVPIKPRYHDVLFPDYAGPARSQLPLFSAGRAHVGNAMKLAYLCHAPTKSVMPGDILIFYRTEDEMQATTIGVVDEFKVLKDPAAIAALVSRRTVYSVDEIEVMAEKDVKVILFRLIRHVPAPASFSYLMKEKIVRGPIQSIIKLDDERYRRLANAVGI